MTMSDRIAVMQKGRIVQIDTPYEAYERPHSPFASAFLGKTNAFAGAVQTRNARCCNVQVKDTLLHVPHEDRSLGNDVNVYIRPEKIRLAQAGMGRLHGRIRLRVFLGNLWLIAVETSFGVVHMTQPNLGTPPPDENSEVGLDWSDDDLRLLDREVAHGQV
jgi:putative spermidine/putrescine transport system ATP-binding protein